MLPRYEFDKEVEKGQGNRYTNHFTGWNQLLVNLYAQITGKKILRDIETGLKMHQNAWYHIGLVNAVRSTISYANAKRSYRIVENTFYHLLKRCQDITPKYKFRFKNPIYTLDSSIIDPCLSLFPWAEFRERKGALKINALLDHRGDNTCVYDSNRRKTTDIKAAKDNFFFIIFGQHIGDR